MNKTIDALKLALEALEEIAQGASSDFEDAWCGAIAENVLPAIREALAEPSEALMSVPDGAHAPEVREQPKESPKFDPNESFAREEAAQARVREFMRNH